MTDFIFQSPDWILPTLMFVIMSLAIELPYRLARFFSKFNPKIDSINTVQAALLTLSAFVVGLSFSQASARFDARRSLVVREANAIGTTWLRAQQLDAPQARQFRRLLTDDTAARLAVYDKSSNPERDLQMRERADSDQRALWNIANTALRAHPTFGLSLLTQSLNETIDIIAEQRQSLVSHVPTAIIILTLCLVTLGALSLGIRFAVSGSRPFFLSLIYVLAYVIVIEMMIDYDRPNTGFVTISLTPLTAQLQEMESTP
ncbi:MAG TPA: hypothetical protein VMB20_07985 [Candidatus Acidoferrum sp.]|nr:hypothetical protein [Candidatus Acidoferrum sp.]